MKSLFPTSKDRGSVILIAMIAITLITIVAISILSYSSFSYRSSQRKLRLAQLSLVASNDMEYLFFRWSNSFTKPLGLTIEQQLAQGHVLVDLNADGDPTRMSTDPTLTSAVVDYTDASPRLNALSFNRSLIDTNVPAQGQVTDNSGLTKTGNVKYWTVKTRAWMTDPILGTMEARVGRRFTYQAVSSCNGAIYYQGDMEFGASGQMDIFGDIQSNANVYMGSRSGTLTVHDQIYYLTGFNGATNLTGTQYSILPSASSLYSPAAFSNSAASQVTQLHAQDNMVGLGTSGSNSPSAIAAAYPSAYPNGVNDVYRSLIAPPPTDGSGSAIAEDQSVSDNRMYNKAGLRITVGPGNSITVVDPTTGTDPSNGAIAAAITAVRQPVYDAREQKMVNMTTIDVSQLTTAINNAQNPSNNPSGWAFNGVLYVYDSNASAVSTYNGQPDLNGIRLKNGDQTPNFPYTAGDPNAPYLPSTGFTVASDNGVYVQGNFNTATNPSSTTTTTNRTAIMADAVTVLSAGWNDTNSTGSIDPASPQYRGASADLTVNSAILTGNTASQITSTTNPVTGVSTQAYAVDSHGQPIQSGGVQNLVRYLEDWYYPNHNTTVNGSMAQLFNSKYFNSHYFGTGPVNNVYNAPVTRQLKFNSDLASNPPNGVPASLTKYYRGDLFQW